MRNKFINLTLSAAVIVAGLLTAAPAYASGTILVSAPTLPVQVSADNFVSGTSVDVGTIQMAENSADTFQKGTITLNAPKGFVFDTASQVQVNIAGSDLHVLNINGITNGNLVNATTTESQITFVVSSMSAQADTLTWSNIKVLPTAGTSLASGSITIDGTSITNPSDYSVTNPVLLTETAGAPNAGNSSFTCQPNAQTAGGISTCDITVKDRFGNPVPNDSVSLSATGSDNHFSTNSSFTDPNGKTAITLESGFAEEKTVTATIGTAGDGSPITLPTQTVQFYGSIPTKATIVANPNPQEASLGGATVNLAVSVTDQYGNPVANNTPVWLSFSSSSATGTPIVSCTSNAPSRTVGNVASCTLTYNYKGDITLTADSPGDLSTTGDNVIHFVDTTHPVITLAGSGTASVEFRTPYTDAGATANDNIDGNITGSIVTVNPVDTNTIVFHPAQEPGQIVGTYTVTYNVSDSSGNPATQVTRTVNVVDTTAPVISSITSDATAPGALKIGDQIHFVLTPSTTEPYDTVTGSYNSVPLTWSTSNGGVTYTATYTVVEGNADQTSSLQISNVTMTDEAGNVSAPNGGMDIVKTINATRPVLTSVHIQSSNANPVWAKVGDTVTVTFTSSEPITPGFAGIAFRSATISGSGTSWTASYVMQSHDHSGLVPFLIKYADLAGNTGANVSAVTDGSSVTFDKTPPVAPTLILPTYINQAGQTSVNLTGSGEANALISYDFTDGTNHVTGTSTVDGSGNINVTADLTSLADGPVTVSATLTDAAGNVGPAGTAASTKDTVAPVIASMANISAVEATSPSGAVVTYTAPNSTDAHDGTLPSICSPASGSTFALGTATVTCTKTDLAGNVATPVTFTITVVDTTPPVITAPVDQTFEATGPMTTPTLVPATAVDLVDPAPVVTYAPHSFAVGANQVVTWTATDASHNTSTITSLVTITDNTPPVIAATADITAEATSAVGAVVTYTNPVATDLVDVTDPVTCGPVSGSTFPLGPTTVTCASHDNHNNVATSTTFTVTVVDTTPPVIAHHNDVTAEATSPTTTVVTYTNPTATDLVDGTTTVICNPASGSAFNFGANTVTCTSTDAHSNTATSTFAVTVVDTTPPTINGTPGNMVVVANATGGASAVTYTLPTATDIVDVTDPVTCSLASGSFFPLGVNTVTCNSQDKAGNKAASTSFTVTVNPAPISQLIVTANPVSLPTNQSSTVTVTGEDQYNNVVTNNSASVVTVSADNGGAFSGSPNLTLSSGVATVGLTDTSAVLVHVSAISGSLTPGSTTVTFTPVDPNPPTVTTTVPASGATGVAVTAPLFMNFNKTLLSTSITPANIQLMQQVSTSTNTSDVSVPATISLVSGGTQVELIPTSPLLYSTSYYFVVNGVVSSFGISMSAPYSSLANSFTTAANTADVTPPTVENQFPLAAATGVAVTVQPTVAFSEAMNVATLIPANVYLVADSAPATAIPATVVVANGGTTAIIEPTGALSANTNYHVIVTTAVTDLAGNALVSQYTGGSFTTLVPVLPTVIDQYPLPATSTASPAVQPYVDFSEAMDATTLTNTNVELIKTSDNSVVPATVVVANGGTRAVIEPAAPLAVSTGYYISVTTAVADLSGNHLSSNYFTTSFNTAADSTVLAVTGTSLTQSFATPDNTFADGWKWQLSATAPTAETKLQMKFTDFLGSSTTTIPANSNIEFYSPQSSDHADEAHAVVFQSSSLDSNGFSLPLIDLNSDLDPVSQGRQFQVIVEVRVPVGTPGGSYSDSYAIETTP